MIEQFKIQPYKPNRRSIQGNKFALDVTDNIEQEAQAFVNWINARLTELNLDVDAFDPKDTLNVMYAAAMHLSQGGAYDNLAKRMRYYVMQQLAMQAVLNNPHADVVECGCWHGHSTLLIEQALIRGASPDSRLHVFDSFEGLSPLGTEDKSAFVTPAMERKLRDGFRSDLDALQEKVTSRTVLHKGWIPHVFGDAPHPLRLSFASIDVDLYAPTRAALEFVYPRVVSGGVIYLDDYGYKVFPGAKMAVDNFTSQHPTTLLVKLPTGSAFIVK